MTIRGTEEMTEVWTPKIITGGKTADTPTDWLWDLNLGDVFFCKTKESPVGLQLFQIAAKLEQNNNRMMRLENPEMEDQHIAVDTREFSKRFIFHMLLDGVTDGDGSTVEESRMD